MTYLKLITETAKRHLVLPGQDPEGIATLCGCTITRARNWRAITPLEGDECAKCADLSFSVSKLHGWLKTSDHDSRGPAVSVLAE